MNCYLNITVVDNEVNQDKGAPIVLTTINCDGVKRFWNADDIEEFHRWWQDEEYDGPAAEDEVLEFIVNGKKADVGIFNDIVTIYDFDKEITSCTVTEIGEEKPNSFTFKGRRDPYKVEQIGKIMNASEFYAYLSGDKTSGAKTINLDGDVLEIVKAFYEGKKIVVKEVTI